MYEWLYLCIILPWILNTKYGTPHTKRKRFSMNWITTQLILWCISMLNVLMLSHIALFHSLYYYHIASDWITSDRLFVWKTLHHLIHSQFSTNTKKREKYIYKKSSFKYLKLLSPKRLRYEFQNISMLFSQKTKDRALMDVNIGSWKKPICV